MKSVNVFFLAMLGFSLLVGNDRWCIAQETPSLDEKRDLKKEDILYLTEDQENEVIRYLEKTYPDRIRDVINFKKRRPNLYKQAISRGFREMRRLGEIQATDPARFERILKERSLEKECRDLARSYNQSGDSAEKQKLRSQLLERLEILFDLRQTNRSEETASLENKRAELKKQNEKRLVNKKQIVEKRLEQVLGDTRDLEW
jgi:hypothetical protein